MKTAVEKAGPTRAKLSVEVPFSELQDHVDAAYKKIAQQVQLPGFRKGKVPAGIIDKRFGRGVVLDEAVNDAIPTLYTQALQENELEPLGRPEVDVTDLVDGEHLNFTAEVDVKPDIEVPEYEGTRVEVDGTEVDDEEVQEQLKQLAQRFGSLTEVERAAADTDFVTIDLTATDTDGNELSEVANSGLSYQLGSGQGIEGLDEAVTGLSAGESKTFRSQLAGGEYEGKEADVTVTVSQVREQKLPELDDEFAQMASEFDTIEEFAENLREQLTRQKRLQQAADARDKVLEALLDKADIPLPDAAIDEEVSARKESMDQQLQQYGLSWEQYLTGESQTQEEFDTDLRQRAEDALRGQFLLDEVAKKQEVGVSEQELTEHLVRRAQQAGANPEDFAQQVMQNNYLPVLVREIVRGKALAHLVEAAEVVDPTGEALDFTRVTGDGRLLTPEEKAELDAAARAANEQAAQQPAGDGFPPEPEGPAEGSDPIPDGFHNVEETFRKREYEADTDTEATENAADATEPGTAGADEGSDD